jgi:hypothetical protein
VFLDHHPSGLECFLQDVDRRSRIGVAAHEHVKRGIAIFRPAMDGDMRLRQNGYARNAAVRREVVEVNMQECSPRNLHTPPKSLVDVVYIVEAFSPNEIDDEMGASVANPIALTEKVLVPLSFGERAPGKLFFRLGGA